MGCGMSTLDDENATLSRYSSILRRHSIVRPVTDNNSPTNKLPDNGGDERVIENGGEKEVRMKRAAEKEQSGNGELEKNIGENEQVAYQCEYLIAPRSPSFRDYCIDSDSGDQSFREHFNDTDSAESTKNGIDEASAKRNDKPGENKDSKKKERRRLGFRNAINKGMPKGKRNLLNFGCYTSRHASYDDNTLKKVAEKSA